MSHLCSWACGMSSNLYGLKAVAALFWRGEWQHWARELTLQSLLPGVDSPFLKYYVFSGYQGTLIFTEPLVQIIEWITLERYVSRETRIQIITRYLLYARWYIGTKDTEINMLDTEQTEGNTSHFHFKNKKTEAHKG